MYHGESLEYWKTNHILTTQYAVYYCQKKISWVKLLWYRKCWVRRIWHVAHLLPEIGVGREQKARTLQDRWYGSGGRNCPPILSVTLSVNNTVPSSLRRKGKYSILLGVKTPCLGANPVLSRIASRTVLALAKGVESQREVNARHIC